MPSDILFERRGAAGLITLNRPQALNAVSLAMVRALAKQLAEWEAVASRPNHYLMVSGHPRSEGEQIVGSVVGEYDVVQKPD